MTILIAIIAAIVGVGGGYAVRTFIGAKHRRDAEARSAALLKEAKEKARELELEAKEKAQQQIDAMRAEDAERRKELVKLEARLDDRQSKLDVRSDDLDTKREALDAEKRKIDTQKEQLLSEKERLTILKEEQHKKLEEVAGLSKDQAREELIASVEEGMRDVLADRMRRRIQAAKEEADKEAKMIASIAIQRYASSQVSETTATSVTLASEDLKGRIIGKEGRNIKHLEEQTGCELIIDETPNSILISSFNPIRRHVCKQALEQLLKDGRIHPGRIEEVVEKVKKNIANDIKEAGESTINELQLHNVHPKLVHLLGRLKFRSSYGQNVLQHSVEMAHVARVLAEMIGADAAIAKRAALFHDIGKAVDHEIEGTHVEIGRNILKKFGESDEVIHAMECHHEEYEPRTPEAHIVNAVDAISAGRPGARRRTFETFVKRVEDLENIANSFDGVERSYAIYAGREVRVFVRPEKVDDLGAMRLADGIARKIEKDVNYPGEVKVHVIRETRATEIAK